MGKGGEKPRGIKRKSREICDLTLGVLLFGFVLEIKGMRATFSSSLSLETVGINPRKNLEISRFKGGAMG